MSYVDSHRARIYYDAVGDGPPLIFLHGGGGNAASWWRQVGEFARDHRCILIDNRGFGRSPLSDSTLYDPKRFKDDVLAVMEREKIEAAAFVCQSLGGWTGLRLALSEPDRVSRLVVSNSPMGVDFPPAIADGKAFTDSLVDKSVDIETAALGQAYRERDPAGVFLYRHLSQFNPYSDRGEGTFMSAKERSVRIFAPDYVLPLEALGDVRCPVLLIAGEEDRIVRPATMQTYADRMPNARLIVAPGAGHSPFWETPEFYNQSVRRFLTEPADSH